MITSIGPIGASGMTAAAATKRDCSRMIDFTDPNCNVALNFISTNVNVTKATLFVETAITNNALKLNIGTDADATAIVASDALVDPGAGAFVDIPLPTGGVDVDAGVDGHMLLVTVAAAGGAGKGQLAIEYHERD